MIMSSVFEKTPADYWTLLKRRRGFLLATIAVILPVAALVAYLVPPSYRSTAMILIEEPEVPPELVESTVTSYADQRIQMIKYRVMTSDTLTTIMDRYGLYTALRKDLPLTEVLEVFRSDINVETIDAQVQNPRSGRASRSTIAFTVSYSNREPRQAQQVANELVTLYLAENTRERQTQAAATTQFLTQESDRLANRVRDLETRLAKFKEENAGRLPTQLEANLDLIDRAQRDIADLERRIESLKQRRIEVSNQLELVSNQLAVSGGETLGPGQSISLLRQELAQMRDTHGPNHPELRTLTRQIALLEAAIRSGSRGSRGGPDALARAEANALASSNGLMSFNADRPRAPSAIAASHSLSPVYMQLRSQLETNESELAELQDRRESYAARLRQYEARVLATPEVEREYRTLVRDYDTAQRNYMDTRDKQLAAELSQALETESKSERFSLIEPPQMPTRPIGLDRTALFGLALLFSIVIGIAILIVIDFFDDRVHGPRQLGLLAGEAPLVVVPYIMTPTEQDRLKFVRTASIAGAVAAVSLSAALVHFLIIPLDVLWFKTIGMVGGSNRIL